MDSIIHELKNNTGYFSDTSNINNEKLSDTS